MTCTDGSKSVELCSVMLLLLLLPSQETYKNQGRIEPLHKSRKIGAEVQRTLQYKSWALISGASSVKREGHDIEMNPVSGSFCIVSGSY